VADAVAASHTADAVAASHMAGRVTEAASDVGSTAVTGFKPNRKACRAEKASFVGGEVRTRKTPKTQILKPKLIMTQNLRP
jgi:hypothetical protein